MALQLSDIAGKEIILIGVPQSSKYTSKTLPGLLAPLKTRVVVLFTAGTDAGFYNSKLVSSDKITKAKAKGIAMFPYTELYALLDANADQLGDPAPQAPGEAVKPVAPPKAPEAPKPAPSPSPAPETPVHNHVHFDQPALTPELLKGRTITMAGKPPKALTTNVLADKLKPFGATVRMGFNKATTVVFYRPDYFTDDKLETAKKAGLLLYSYDEVQAFIEQHVDGEPGATPAEPAPKVPEPAPKVPAVPPEPQAPLTPQSFQGKKVLLGPNQGKSMSDQMSDPEYKSWFEHVGATLTGNVGQADLVFLDPSQDGFVVKTIKEKAATYGYAIHPYSDLHGVMNDNPVPEAEPAAPEVPAAPKLTLDTIKGWGKVDLVGMTGAKWASTVAQVKTAFAKLGISVSLTSMATSDAVFFTVDQEDSFAVKHSQDFGIPTYPIGTLLPVLSAAGLLPSEPPAAPVPQTKLTAPKGGSPALSAEGLAGKTICILLESNEEIVNSGHMVSPVGAKVTGDPKAPDVDMYWYDTGNANKPEVQAAFASGKPCYTFAQTGAFFQGPWHEQLDAYLDDGKGEPAVPTLDVTPGQPTPEQVKGAKVYVFANNAIVEEKMEEAVPQIGAQLTSLFSSATIVFISRKDIDQGEFQHNATLVEEFNAAAAKGVKLYDSDALFTLAQTLKQAPSAPEPDSLTFSPGYPTAAELQGAKVYVFASSNATWDKIEQAVEKAGGVSTSNPKEASVAIVSSADVGSGAIGKFSTMVAELNHLQFAGKIKIWSDTKLHYVVQALPLVEPAPSKPAQAPFGPETLKGKNVAILPEISMGQAAPFIPAIEKLGGDWFTFYKGHTQVVLYTTDAGKKLAEDAGIPAYPMAAALSFADKIQPSPTPPTPVNKPLTLELIANTAIYISTSTLSPVQAKGVYQPKLSGNTTVVTPHLDAADYVFVNTSKTDFSTTEVKEDAGKRGIPVYDINALDDLLAGINPAPKVDPVDQAAWTPGKGKPRPKLSDAFLAGKAVFFPACSYAYAYAGQIKTKLVLDVGVNATADGANGAYTVAFTHDTVSDSVRTVMDKRAKAGAIWLYTYPELLAYMGVISAPGEPPAVYQKGGTPAPKAEPYTPTPSIDFPDQPALTRDVMLDHYATFASGDMKALAAELGGYVRGYGALLTPASGGNASKIKVFFYDPVSGSKAPNFSTLWAQAKAGAVRAYTVDQLKAFIKSHPLPNGPVPELSIAALKGKTLVLTGNAASQGTEYQNVLVGLGLTFATEPKSKTDIVVFGEDDYQNAGAKKGRAMGCWWYTTYRFSQFISANSTALQTLKNSQPVEPPTPEIPTEAEPAPTEGIPYADLTPAQLAGKKVYFVSGASVSSLAYRNKYLGWLKAYGAIPTKGNGYYFDGIDVVLYEAGYVGNGYSAIGSALQAVKDGKSVGFTYAQLSKLIQTDPPKFKPIPPLSKDVLKGRVITVAGVKKGYKPDELMAKLADLGCTITMKFQKDTQIVFYAESQADGSKVAAARASGLWTYSFKSVKTWMAREIGQYPSKIYAPTPSPYSAPKTSEPQPNADYDVFSPPYLGHHPVRMAKDQQTPDGMWYRPHYAKNIRPILEYGEYPKSGTDTKHMPQAFVSYTGSGYTAMNNALSGFGSSVQSLDSRYQQYIEDLIVYIQLSPQKHTLLYRGVNNNKGAAYKYWDKKVYHVGARVPKPAFVSTSWKQQTPFNFSGWNSAGSAYDSGSTGEKAVMITFKVGPGVKGVEAYHMGEAEWVIQANCTYEITGIKDEGPNRKWFEMTIHPDPKLIKPVYQPAKPGVVASSRSLLSGMQDRLRCWTADRNAETTRKLMAKFGPYDHNGW